MRAFLISAFILASIGGYAQKNLSAKNKVDTAIDMRYVKFTGTSFVDVRKATPEQLKLIKYQERLNYIKNERFLFYSGGVAYGRYENLAVRFQQNTGSNIYEGTNTNWDGHNIRSIIIEGTASVDFASIKMSKENAKSYRYHIVENFNKEIIGWKAPDTFKTSSDNKTTYAYLGKFDYHPGQVLLVEIYNINNYSDRDALIIDWRPIKAVKLSVGIQRSDFSSLIYTSLDDLKNNSRQNFIETTNYNDKKFRLGDSLVRLHISMKSSGSTFYNYNVKLKRMIQGKSGSLVDLGDHKDQLFVYKEFWKEPGHYELIFTPKLPSPGGNPIKYYTGKAVGYKFTVLPPLNQSFEISYKALGLSIAAILILAGLITWHFMLKNKIKVLAETQKKDFALVQIASMRAQLNPHFMYNALAGIQNLINKNDMDTANRYLGKFARLTRSVLNEKNNDLTSISDEKSLIDDYLQMEQLRFGFTYNILVSEEIDILNTEIPAMLLQPFVENAIKHGIADLNQNGNIEISFSKVQDDLILTVKDNGKGFDTSLNYPGLGLNLSKNRISLLNTIYKNTPIKLQLQATKHGTSIIITLKDWL